MLQADGPLGLYVGLHYFCLLNWFNVIAFVIIFYILRQLVSGGKSKTANILTGLCLDVCRFLSTDNVL